MNINKHNALGVIIALISIIILGCADNIKTQQLSAAERHRIDSVVNAVKDTTVLKNIITKQSNTNNILNKIIAYRLLGKVFRDNCEYSKAIRYHSDGLHLATTYRDTLEIVQALNNLGTDFRRVGVMDEATRNHIGAINILTQYSDKQSFEVRKYRVVALNGMGNIFLTLGNWVSADSVFRLSLAGEKSLNSALGQAINYANIGAIKEHLGDLDSAWIYYQHSLEENSKAGSALGIALCHVYFGDIYDKRGDNDKAIKQYSEAYDMLQNEHDQWHMLEAIISLSRIYLKMGDNANCKRYLLHADSIASRIKSTEHQTVIQNLLYQLYRKEGNYKTALEHYILSQSFSDSLVNVSNLNRIQNYRISLERKYKERELDAAQDSYDAKMRAKNIMIIGILVMVLMTVAIIVMLVYTLRMRKQRMDEVERMVDVREQFFTNVTHEFRTPLTVILGAAHDMANAGEVNLQKLRQSGNMILRQGNALLQLINQLLDIAKIKSTIGNPYWRRGNVIPYIHMIVESYQQLAKSKNISMFYHPQVTELVMDVVPDYLQKIVVNLVGNAIKFNNEGGTVDVGVERNDEQIIIKVSDDGVGISQTHLPHIFEAFYHVDNKASQIGTGVGLSLVKQAVEALHGTITVDSVVGKGTTFVVTLPLVYGDSSWQPLILNMREVMKMSPRYADVTVLPEDASVNATAPRILVVEDNADVATFIGNQLSDLYNVIYASTGDEGLSKAMTQNPDIVLTDLMMPGIDGLELCRRIRADKDTNHLPIIIISARTTQADREAGLRAGASDYMVKPFNRDELRLRIQRIIEERNTLREKYALVALELLQNKHKLNGDETDFITRFTNVIYAQMKDCTFDMDTIAQKMCMSRSTLSRKILMITGHSPSTYISHIRVDYAKQLLKTYPELTATDIAYRCGYEDAAYFSRIFKQIEGVSPMQYRRNITT